MLAILATHPIQYQVPLWQKLAEDGSVPFEVWYLSEHATRLSRDREFDTDFLWDIDMLEGYRHRFLSTPPGSTPNMPLRLRVTQSLPGLFQETGAKVLWVQGWQVAAYWQAVWAAKRAGLQVWLRGESNNLAPANPWKILPKKILLGQFFDRVDQFLCIGSANRELYRSYGVPVEKLLLAPYAVDNDRFQRQAEAIRGSPAFAQGYGVTGKSEIRRQWNIPEDAFVVLFCGKFIPKKRPMDLIEAIRLLITDNSITDNRAPKAHLLFVGSGELGNEMRSKCNVVFDAESIPTSDLRPPTSEMKPRASFAGFLNQTEISKAYVAADVLVLPSDYGETWGLVVNEAMASGLPCIISDHCGCAPDLGRLGSNATFHFGDVEDLARRLHDLIDAGATIHVPQPPSLEETSTIVRSLLGNLDCRG